MNEHADQRYGELDLALTLGGVVLAVAVGSLARRAGQNADGPAQPSQSWSFWNCRPRPWGTEKRQSP